MTTTVRILFIAGSTRKGSLNERLAHLGADIARANGIAATLADLGQYPLPIYDGDIEAASGPPDNARKLKTLLGEHQGVFIAAPEYNASITPLLKNTLDWISRVRVENEAPLHVFRSRVFALGAASPGGFGGMRGLMALRQTLELGLGCLVLPEQIVVPRAADAFDDHGHLEDKGVMEAYKALLQKLARAAQATAG
ncbi:MAG: NAD(P)H-dependent oxidoreductase [Vicinamibacterales bacterium]